MKVDQFIWNTNFDNKKPRQFKILKSALNKVAVNQIALFWVNVLNNGFYIGDVNFPLNIAICVRDKLEDKVLVKRLKILLQL